MVTMTHFDVCNGDADGLCALHQLRLAFPRQSTLVTGIKRDIALVKRVHAQQGDSVTVLDISFDTNRTAIMDLLDKGVVIDYFDHRSYSTLPSHPGLRASIETDPGVCTAILVDRFLSGRYRLWAIVAAFGDNLLATACTLCNSFGLSHSQQIKLRECGFCINYASYGDTEDDLIIHPAAMYKQLQRYSDPLVFLANKPMFGQLRTTYAQAMAKANHCSPQVKSDAYRIFILPAAAWSRRIRGAYANKLASEMPTLAHAVLTPNTNGYTVSVRAAMRGQKTADRFCLMFASGGGRPSAGGIKHLASNDLNDFLEKFHIHFMAT